MRPREELEAELIELYQQVSTLTARLAAFEVFVGRAITELFEKEYGVEKW